MAILTAEIDRHKKENASLLQENVRLREENGAHMEANIALRDELRTRDAQINRFAAQLLRLETREQERYKDTRGWYSSNVCLCF